MFKLMLLPVWVACYLHAGKTYHILVNARTGIERHHWGVYLWAKNLTNERYYEDYNSSKFSGLPYDIGSLAEPRTYGVEFKVTY